MGNGKAILALADGRIFQGTAFGARGEAVGEVVFNTSMTGYQEILTDPSYAGQMVCMTYPLIGNYGINSEDVESTTPQVQALIVREASTHPSSWRNRGSLGDYLVQHGIVGIEGIDTRALTRHIRDCGAQTGVVSSIDPDAQSLVKKAHDAPTIEGVDLVQGVTCRSPYMWNQGDWSIARSYENYPRGVANEPQFKRTYKVVAYDFGIKFNILRLLTAAGCELTVVPAAFDAERVLAMEPDGIFLSNGPGDPSAVPYAAQAVRRFIEAGIPLFGICLGHQILGLALGGKTYKLKFGHHGGNHPVMDLTTNKVEITAQNHGFAVDVESLQGLAELTHVNLNDQTVEGMQLTGRPVFSVQYHPEASPGPHDPSYLFARFIENMRREKDA
ncbi:MAG: glutamine-hydrolyzing carbamoyl-phosphate synthase small subunit [Candidatus Alcyoniella australis]|nr:glutamine-hydrolyzing carbamoyl-phosphate synthase small subunit [Candidatus Alcyoniella australis]